MPVNTVSFYPLSPSQHFLYGQVHEEGGRCPLCGKKCGWEYELTASLSLCADLLWWPPLHLKSWPCAWGGASGANSYPHLGQVNFNKPSQARSPTAGTSDFGNSHSNNIPQSKTAQGTAKIKKLSKRPFMLKHYLLVSTNMRRKAVREEMISANRHSGISECQN